MARSKSATNRLYIYNKVVTSEFGYEVTMQGDMI
jgi:hypothetical protein